MLYFIGSMTGVYLVYALFAAIFRHKIAFIITAVLGIGGGIMAWAIRGAWQTLPSAAITLTLIVFIPKIQIKKNVADIVSKIKANTYKKKQTKLQQNYQNSNNENDTTQKHTTAEVTALNCIVPQESSKKRKFLNSVKKNRISIISISTALVIVMLTVIIVPITVSNSTIKNGECSHSETYKTTETQTTKQYAWVDEEVPYLSSQYCKRMFCTNNYPHFHTERVYKETGTAVTTITVIRCKKCNKRMN